MSNKSIYMTSNLMAMVTLTLTFRIDQCQIKSPYMTSYLMTILIFAISFTISKKPKRQPLIKQRSMSLWPPRIPSSRSPSKQDVPAWCPQSAEFIEDLGRRITTITNKSLKTTYLYQRVSVTPHRCNAVTFHNNFPEH